ncbi:hypothetical protein, partial [Methylicorpusculum sp.]|uniref:hypothetical protein n=1 Tax=Methylicorpusculum sp. TaxID=2713644 RepID=UPI002ABCA8E7
NGCAGGQAKSQDAIAGNEAKRIRKVCRFMLKNFRHTLHKIHFLFHFCNLQEALSGVAFANSH